MNSTTTKQAPVNGVDVGQLFQTIEALKGMPSLARFKFRIRNEWVDSGYNRSTVDGFYGAGEERPHARRFVLEADEPPLLLGKDQGANPVEHLLHALAACVTSAMVYHAAARGIEIDEVESDVDGDIDLHGFLGLDPNIRKGYQQIRMKFRIKADVPQEKIEEICRLGPGFSPVFDSVTNGVPVVVTAEKA